MQDNCFVPFPHLRSAHLHLRQLSPSDGQDIFMLRSDAALNTYLNRPQTHSLGEALAFIDKINTNVARNESILWAITLSGKDRLVGTICLWNINIDRTIAEIGYELLPDFQGKKIMHEAIPVVIAFGFTVMQLESITAEVRADNYKSLNLLDKNGFRRLADSSKLPEPSDGDAKIFTYSIMRSAWSGRQGDAM
jgi:[ribosomal protein S5]-alanine N-acetyltransferase